AADPKKKVELNAKAAAVMAGADVEVYQQGQRFVVPPEYEPPTGDRGTTTPFVASAPGTGTMIGHPQANATASQQTQPVDPQRPYSTNGGPTSPALAGSTTAREPASQW